MSKEFEEIVLKKLDNLGDGLKYNTQRLGNLEIEVKGNSQWLGNLEKEVKGTGEVVNYLNQRFTKFDYEINKK